MNSYRIAGYLDVIGLTAGFVVPIFSRNASNRHYIQIVSDDGLIVDFSEVELPDDQYTSTPSSTSAQITGPCIWGYREESGNVIFLPDHEFKNMQFESFIKKLQCNAFVSLDVVEIFSEISYIIDHHCRIFRIISRQNPRLTVYWLCVCFLLPCFRLLIWNALSPKDSHNHLRWLLDDVVVRKQENFIYVNVPSSLLLMIQATEGKTDIVEAFKEKIENLLPQYTMIVQEQDRAAKKGLNDRIKEGELIAISEGMEKSKKFDQWFVHRYKRGPFSMFPSWQKQSNSNYGSVILGPSGAGKTALIACLHLSGTTDDQSSLDKGFSVVPDPGITNDLFRRARQSVKEGRFPINASTEINRYGFTIKISRVNSSGGFPMIRLLGGPAREYRFEMLDGPGGAIFPNHQDEIFDDKIGMDRFRQQQIDSLRGARGVILCIDPTAQHTSEAFFIDLPYFLAELNLKRLPIERIVFALTKADKYFYQSGSDAFDLARANNPVEIGQKLVTRHALNALRSSLPSALFGFCWTSIYGFTKDGRANYNPEVDSLGSTITANGERVNASDRLIDSWNPFQIIDPFLFICNGNTENVKTLE